MELTQSFLFLQQEGHLIRSCLTHGLTALRNSNLNEKGNYYAAFFHLSIGLERMMKTVIILDHMATNRLAAPSEAAMRKLGHDLLKLFSRLSQIGVKTTPHPLAAIRTTDIEYDVLSFLSEFARRTRYFNLDSLAAPTACADPLLSWYQVLKRILEEDVSDRRKARIIAESAAFAQAMNGLALVVGHDLNKDSLDLKQALSRPQLQDEGARYAVYHVLKLVGALKECISDVTDRAQAVNHEYASCDAAVPYMSEFFDFVYHDRRSILTKKRWP